jgi:hypothetical protein
MRATRLRVANYNTTLSSDSLESGTGSSNPLRSTNESLRTDNELLLIVTLGAIGPKQHGTFFDKKRPTAEFANVYDETGDRKACHLNFAIDYPAASPNGGPKNARSVNCSMPGSVNGRSLPRGRCG